MSKSKGKSKSKSKSNNKTIFTQDSWIKELSDYFSDDCLFDANGKRVRGPGILCSLWISLIILGTILNIIMSWKLLYKHNINNLSIVIQNVIEVLISFIMIVFIYNMCYKCRGLLAFFLVMLFSIGFNIIRWFLFSSYNLAIMESTNNELASRM